MILGKSVPARVNASPDLATRRSIFGYRDNAWTLVSPPSRQRPPDQSRNLRHPPSDPAKPDLDDLADINGGLAILRRFEKRRQVASGNRPNPHRTATREI